MDKVDTNNTSNNNFGKCKCCPYGHHVGLDFVEFAKESVEKKDIHKVKRFQQKLERKSHDQTDSSSSPSSHCIIYDEDSDISVLSDDNNKKQTKTKMDKKSFVISYEHLMSIREQMSTSLKRVQELEMEVKHIHHLKQTVELLTQKNQELELKLKSEILPKFEMENTSSSYSPCIFDRHTQAEMTPPPSARVKRRNFGVTVKPNHHHFTQQITTTPIYRGVSIDEHLTRCQNWLNNLKTDTDANFGYLICHIFNSCLNDNFPGALLILSSEIELIIEFLKKSQMTDNSCQTEYVNKQMSNMFGEILPQINSVEESSETPSVSYHDASVDASSGPVNSKSLSVDINVNKVTFHDKCTINDDENSVIKTLFYNKCTTNEPVMNDVGLNTTIVQKNEVSSSTDHHLIDDLIAVHIEESMNLIHEELKLEIDQSRPTVLVDSSTVQTQTISSLVHYSTVYEQSLQESCSLFDQRSVNLGRSSISQMSIVDTNPDSHDNQAIEDVDEDSMPTVELSHEERSKEIYEYCTKTDGLPTYSNDVTKANSHIKKLDGDTNSSSELPDDIRKSCELFTTWMNDSTTICSKDLNKSLSSLRNFWFEITENDSTVISDYLEQFDDYNPIMKEKIVNMTDSNGNTCLHYAVSAGRWSIVKQVLDTNLAYPNKTNKAGYSVLMLTAISDEFDESTIRHLINESDVDQRSANELRQTALMIGSGRGRLQLVQWLLEAGASINSVDSTGSTALMCACDNGHLEVVKMLLSRNDINTELVDNTGCNAMKIAMDNSYKDVALLIFAKNNLQKTTNRSKRRSGSNSQSNQWSDFAAQSQKTP